MDSRTVKINSLNICAICAAFVAPFSAGLIITPPVVRGGAPML